MLTPTTAYQVQSPEPAKKLTSKTPSNHPHLSRGNEPISVPCHTLSFSLPGIDSSVLSLPQLIRKGKFSLSVLDGVINYRLRESWKFGNTQNFRVRESSSKHSLNVYEGWGWP